MPQIFISHNYKDKIVVEPIALRLASVFGKENVFYDSWSIQPGEGIIDKMGQGLFDCDFFFFFVSKNSLQSKMVKLEWQNALYKTTNSKIKLIPVKLDDCLMPDLLMQTLYIDIFGKGLEFGIRQMIDVISGKNVFAPSFQTYENVRAIVTYSEKATEIEIKAITYSEPIARFLLLTDENLNEISVKSKSDSMMMTGKAENIQLNNGSLHNGLFRSVSRGLTPGFPFRLTLTKNKNEPVRLCGIMKAINEKQYQEIPVEEQQK